MYKPNPLNTESIEIPGQLKGLIEEMAEHAHEVWARGRVREGWKYGEKRDDDAKTHPCLVPYGDLGESEKEYDRRAAVETIKLIIALGFRIVSPGV